jgi:MtN3 and saliva related transmembrane protein
MNKNSVQTAPKSTLLLIYEKYMVVVGVLGQLLFYTQGVKIFMTQSASDISLLGFLLGLISVTSWLVYGILIKNKVLIIANAFAVIGALFVVTGVLIHGD